MAPDPIPSGQLLIPIDRVPIVLMQKVVPNVGVFFHYATNKAEIDGSIGQGYAVLDSSFGLWKEAPERPGSEAVHRMVKGPSQALIRNSSLAPFLQDGWQSFPAGPLGYADFQWAPGTLDEVPVRSRYSYSGTRALQAPLGVLASADEDLAGVPPFTGWASWPDFGALPVSTLWVRTQDGEPAIDAPTFGASGPGGDVAILPGTGRILRFRRGPHEPSLVLKWVEVDATVKLLDLAGTEVGTAELPTPISDLHVADDQILVLDDNTSVVDQQPVAGHTVTALQYEYTLHVEVDGVPHKIDPKVTNQSGGLRNPGGN